MASYYYLMSSLPLLKADEDMPFSYDEFLEMCKGCVGSSKYGILENLTVDSKEGPLISEWHRFYGEFKKELNYQRNVKLGKPVQPPIIRDEIIARTVSAAVNDENPLNAELNLLSLQFEKLDSLIGIHSFDDWFLFGYALKLKLLQRKTVFNKEKGKNELNRIVDDLEQQIMSIG